MKKLRVIDYSNQQSPIEAQSLLAARFRIEDRARAQSLSPPTLHPVHGFQAVTRQVGGIFRPNPPQPRNEQDIPRRYLEGLPKNKNVWDGAIDSIFDIRWRGEVVSVGGQQRVWKYKRNGYARMLRRRFFLDPNKPRYTTRRIFMPDGIRIWQMWNDWNTRARENQTPRYLKEIRRTSREDIQVAHGVDETANLLDYYCGVIGIDIGEVCTAASVFLPSDHTVNGSRMIVKRGYLYGRVIPNVQWLEKRRNTYYIHNIEDGLSLGSPRSSFANLTIYLAALKTDAAVIQLFDFYSARAVRRRLWDNHLSTRSAMDRACHLIMEQSTRTLHENVGYGPHRPTIFALGLDGLSRKSRKGALAPMDHKLSRHLFQRIRQQAHPASITITRIDEYLSSKTCCNCSMNGLNSRVQFLNYPATPYAPQRQSYRVVVCNTCHQRLHRDGNAAHNLALDTWCILRWRQRPHQRIRPSRRLQQ